MGSKPKKKTKTKNTPHRKDPAFYRAVSIIASDAKSTEAELNAKFLEKDPDWKPTLDDHGRQVFNPKFLPEGVTVIDTLNGHWIFNDARLMKHVEMMAVILQEFDDDFWSDFGSSIMDLRRDRKNRVWGDEISILALAYTAIAMDLAHFTKPRAEWKALPGGMPFIKFTGPKHGANFEEVGKTSEQIKSRLDKAAKKEEPNEQASK